MQHMLSLMWWDKAEKKSRLSHRSAVGRALALDSVESNLLASTRQ